MSKSEPRQPPGRQDLVYTRAAVILTGAAVMVVEILGGKLLAPYYGSGIYSWTSIISVTLLALSIGYFIAGKMVEKISSVLPIAMILILSGLSILLLHKIFPVVAQRLGTMDLRWATLLSSMVLIFLPLVMLGTVSLLASKLTCRNMHHYGNSVGVIFALSTISGIVGALLSGFYLAPWLGSAKSLVILSWVLMIAGFAGIVMKKSLRHIAFSVGAVAVALLISFIYKPGHAISVDYQILQKRESLYGEVLVLEDNIKRYLFVDRILQTEESKLIDLFWQKGLSFSEGNYFEMIPHINKTGNSCLIIGLGGGQLGKLFSRYKWQVEAVELDPVVAQIAKAYFDYRGKVHIADGRYFLQQAEDRKWDCILLDVFLGDSVPTHLYTYEMFKLCDRRLSAEGILALNYIGILNSALTKHLVHTLRAVFPEVAVYPQNRTLEGAQFINIFAGKAEKKFPDRIDIGNDNVLQIEKPIYHLTSKASPVILSDTRNPIDLLRHPTALIWREMSRKRFKF